MTKIPECFKIWGIVFMITAFLAAINSNYYLNYFIPTQKSIFENIILIMTIPLAIGIFVATIITIIIYITKPKNQYES
jgi:hypothetical protein